MSVQETESTGPDAPQTSDSSGDEDSELTEDQIFHILQNQRRRHVLRYLQGTDEPVRMRDIAEQVAAWEHDTTVEALSSDQRQRVYIPLYQSHLPKLDKEGLIDYQQSRGIVERKPKADVLDPYLNTDADEADDSDAVDEWDDYYIGATGLAAVILFGAVFELPLLSVVSGMALSVLILMMYTFLTISRYVSKQTAADGS